MKIFHPVYNYYLIKTQSNKKKITIIFGFSKLTIKVFFNLKNKFNKNFIKLIHHSFLHSPLLIFSNFT